MILQSFGGIVPKLSEHMLALNQATIAHDVKLRNGIIEAWHEPCEHATAVTGARTIHLYGCCPASWTDKVSVAELTPDWGRFYITGRNCDNGLEAVLVDTCCSFDYVPVGVPAPLSPLTATADEQCSREADARSYVYTFVNRWGEESAPSPASNIVRVDDGSTVVVSGFETPPDHYHIGWVNIYRASTGFRAADGKVQKPITDYLFVAQIPTLVPTFTDNVAGVYLGAALETQYDRMPPEGLSGVVSIGDQVRLAGFIKNRIYFSEQFQPHNWPAKYDLTLDYHIVHILAQDQRLFVTTDSIPYIIDVSSCDDTKCTPVTSLEAPLPDIGCHYSHGAIMTHHGMLYASPVGIILLQPNGSWHVVTSKWFGETEWRKLRPDTIRMAYWEGFLFFATDMATFLLDINGEPYGDMKGAELVTLSDKPVDMITTDTGKLIFLQDNKMWVWDSGPVYRPYIWQSRQITHTSITGKSDLMNQGPVRDYNWWPGSIKLNGAAKVTITDDHEHPIFERTLAREKWNRMPRRGRHLWYRARFDGTAPVHWLAMGTANVTVNKGL